MVVRVSLPGNMAILRGTLPPGLQQWQNQNQGDMFQNQNRWFGAISRLAIHMRITYPCGLLAWYLEVVCWKQADNPCDRVIHASGPAAHSQPANRSDRTVVFIINNGNTRPITS